MSRSLWVGFLLALLALQMAPATALEQAKRPMKIHKVEAIGLEIWTEYEPEWSTEVKYNGPKAVFVTQSSRLYYPPVAMSFTHHPGMRVADVDFKEVAEAAIRVAAQNYQVSSEAIAALSASPARYSDLDGYEATFSGTANGDTVDVKVFVGRAPGKGPVSMQAFTLKGKLPHVSEQIRRSWQNVKYLE